MTILDKQICDSALVDQLEHGGLGIMRGVDPLDMCSVMESAGLLVGSSVNTLGLLGYDSASPLQVHTEGIYHPDTTPFFLLGCIQPSASGGETQVYDARRAADIVIEERPDLVELCIEYTSSSMANYVTIVPLISEIDGFTTLRFREKISTNRIVDAPPHLDEDEFYDYMKAVLRRSLIVSHPWASGDVIIVNNRITLHGRSPFMGLRKMIRTRVDDPTRVIVY